jgi:hypothetical protein
LIDTLLGSFALYQTLPSDWVADRNGELIFNAIGYAFLINMFAQIIWFPFFAVETSWGYIISSIDIVVMLVSAIYMMMESTRTEVNGWEWAFIRAGMTIYSGFLTTATILNFTVTLKFFGISEFSWISEEQITIVMLYIAFVIYNVASYVELNPLFGAVFLWTVYGIA